MERPDAPHLIARSPLVGRDAELAELRHLLDHPLPRLVTLTGPGGCGKTRLALAIAQFEPDAAFVELASLADPARLAATIAATLGLRDQSERPPLDAIVDALDGSSILLVLDNCEHLLDAVAALVDALLDRCPAVRILATSRAVLGVRGEAAWQVPPLDDASAVRLFAERAHAVRRSFIVGDANHAAVAELCRRLDGLPLAIELTAANVNVLSVDQILTRLTEHRAPLLDAPVRGAAGRHQTLRATIDWSYDLLGDAEREAFQRLAVFAGGWSLEAAEALCGDRAVDVLARLVDRSLVDAHEHDGQVRFRLLETIRQYALERLTASGPQASAIPHRHARYFAAFARHAALGLRDAAPRRWLARLDVDQDNLRAALVWLADHEPTVALEMAAALWWFWFRRGLWHEGRAWLARLLDATSADDASRPEALLGLGVLAWAQGDLVLAERSLAASITSTSDPASRGLALQFLAMDVLAQGDVARARSPVDEGVAALRSLGPSIALGIALASAGVVALAERDALPARAPLTESVALLRALDDPWALALPLRNLGIVAFQSGDLDGADRLVRESLAVLDEIDQRDPWFVSRSLETLAAITAARGQFRRAAQLFGASESLRTRVGAAVLPFYQAAYDQGVAAARSALGRAAFDHAWAAGRALRIDQALAYALQPEPDPRGGLSPREREVLALIGRGLSNRAIAETLVITEKTAEAHVSAVLRKLQVDSRAQAAVWAVEHPD